MFALPGCGGGGGDSTPGTPLPPGQGGATSSTITGTVTDIFGVPVIGASVAFQGKAGTTVQNGNYALPPVTVPSGQTYLNGPITATATINGRTFSGQNTVEVVAGDAITPNTHIVISDPAIQGGLAGTVRDTSGRTLAGARVFAGTLGSSGLGFTNLSSIVAFTDANGNYVLPQLPADTYVVTASLVGYANQTANGVVIRAGQQTPGDFSLSRSNGSVIPVVNNPAANAFTTPTTPTRAAGASKQSRGLAAVRDYLLFKQGRRHTRVVASDRITLKRKTGRDAPAGSIVETVLQWDYKTSRDIYGYAILRSEGNNENFESIALMRDPLGDYFSDLDAAITPDVNYYYNIVPLDTVLFPNEDIGGDYLPRDLAVRPLQPIAATLPAPNATVSQTPTFAWTTVSRAISYHVLVYDRFPDFASDDYPLNPVVDLTGTGTTVTLTTPLTRGRTYYWAVSAQDTANGADQSISAIQAFTVQ